MGKATRQGPEWCDQATVPRPSTKHACGSPAGRSYLQETIIETEGALQGVGSLGAELGLSEEEEAAPVDCRDSRPA